MKNLIYTFLIASFLLFCSLSTTIAQSFIPNMSDVPLMEELILLEDSGFQFDKIEGRILEQMAAGEVSPQKIRQFYDETMPQLGWIKSGQKFIRQNEELMIRIESKDKLSIVTFHIQPR